MRHYLISLLALSVTATAESVLAGGLAISANLSQGITGINRFGDTNEDQLGLRSATDVGLNFRGEYPATRFDLSVGARLTADTDDTSGNIGSNGSFFTDLNPRIVGRVTHSGPRMTTFGSLSVLPTFSADRQFEFIDVTDQDTGAIIGTDRRLRDEDVLQLRISATAGTQLRLDQVNSISLSVGALFREYPEGSESLDPTRSVSATAGWNRAIDSRTSGGLSLGTEFFVSDAAGSNESTSTTLSANLARRFTPRHEGNASLGVSFVDLDGADPTPVGTLGFSYRPTADISLRAGASQRVAQDDDGDIRVVSALSGSASWSVNSISTITLGTGLTFDTPVVGNADDATTFRLTAGYSLRLTEGWRVGLVYGLALESEEFDPISGTDSGTHSVLVRLSRNFDILP